MKCFAFLLTMPRNNAWNGKWTGEGNVYASVHDLSLSGARSEAVYEKLIGNHSYDFGDGWVANVEVKEVNAKQALTLQKATLGFCGYDWMIRSLLTHGKITTD